MTEMHPDGASPAAASVHQPPGDPAMDPVRTEVAMHTALVTDPIDVGAAHDDVLHPQAGGVGVFTGVVRDHHDGQQVTGLVYEAWEERAETALREVAQRVATRHGGVRGIHLVHRIGPMEVGDVSIVCAASAPHRAEALAAASDLIDQVKAHVPIWKREELADGQVQWPGAGD